MQERVRLPNGDLVPPAHLDRLIARIEARLLALKLARFQYQQASGTGVFAEDAAIVAGCAEVVFASD